MPATKIIDTDRDSLHAIEDVVQSLENIGHELPLRDMDHLVEFNNTYLIITRNVRQHARKSSFQDPQFLEYFDTQFVYYYIDALKRYLDNKPTPYAWLQAFEASKDSCSPFISLALGVNAHVNNDIPQVLRDCKASAKHLGDYKLVNRIISDSLDQSLDELSHSDAMLNPKRRILRPPYKIMMKQVIVVWRALAWRNYHRFLAGTLTLQELEASAGRMAVIIKKLPA